MSEEELEGEYEEEEVESEVGEEEEYEEYEEEEAEGLEEEEEPITDSIYSAFQTIDEFKDLDQRAVAERLYRAYQQEKESATALQQYQEVMPIAQEYLANRSDYEKWKASQNQPAAQPQAPPAPVQEKKESWWNPPKLEDKHKRFIVKDENGRDVISPDAPMDAKMAIEDHFAYRQQFADKFLTNPEEALGPMVQEMASKQAAAIVNQQMEDAARNQYVQSVEQANRDWLYDESGNVSREGELTRKAIEQAASMGISSPEARWNYALQVVEADLMRRTLDAQKSQGQQTQFEEALPASAPEVEAPVEEPSQAEATLDYLRRAASRTPSRGNVQNTAPQERQRGLSFEEQLKVTAEQMGLM